MRFLRAALVCLIVLDYLTPGVPVGLFQAHSHAKGAGLTSPFMTGPSDPSQMNGNINNLVNAINVILSPLQGAGLINGAAPGTGTAANSISLTPGVTGAPAQITLQTGADANGSIQIAPGLAGGDIILFSNAATSGNLIFANASMWMPATAFAACPGVIPSQGVANPQAGGNAAQLLPAATIQGFWVFEDWLDRPHFTPGC